MVVNIFKLYLQVPQEKTSNTEDGEEQLDFEAEEGECIEPKPVVEQQATNGDAEEKEVEKGKIRSFPPIYLTLHT